VVDTNVLVRELNRAAEQMFGGRDVLPLRRGGEVMHCLHALDVPEGCGFGPACKDCVVRNSVMSCLQGLSVTRKRTRMTLQIGETRTDLELMVTASPMPLREEPRVLLVLEDITEISELRGLIPICMKCKGIRNDQDYWQSVEEYFKHHIGVEFTHGICPKCLREHYSEYMDDVTAPDSPSSV
jgi:hypothetical protein